MLQFKASVTLTEYRPSSRLNNSLSELLSDHMYEKGGLPPLADILILPSEQPGQDGLIVFELKFNTGGSVSE